MSFATSKNAYARGDCLIVSMIDANALSSGANAISTGDVNCCCAGFEGR
jgi:hypothetical protein